MDTSDSDSSGCAAPFVLNVHHDILLYIFQLNTHTPESEYAIGTLLNTCQCHRYPIDVARHTSQVCRVWRHVMLRSSAIWGSLIDINVIEKSSNLWVDEVMRRTGTSGLSICGNLGQGLSTRTLFASLIAKYWHRIRRFDIVVDRSGWIDVATWEIIVNSPAPSLEKFILSGGDKGRMPSGMIQRQRRLFANYAPSLRRFHCMYGPIDLDYKTAWIEHLSSLTLSSVFGASAILNLLGTTSRLESLLIGGSFPPSEPASEAQAAQQAMGRTKKVHLPRLVRLHIFGSVRLSLLYLQNIVCHPECTLALQVKDSPENVTADQLSLLIKLGAVNALRYHNLHRSYQLRVIFVYHSCDIMFFNPPRGHAMMYFAQPISRMTLTMAGKPPAALSLDQWLSILDPAQLIYITDFEFSNVRHLLSWIDPNDPKFIAFLKALSSVQVLAVIDDTLTLLNDTLLDSALMFPLLKDMRLMLTYNKDPRANIQETLLLFLSRRKAAQVPVSVLYMDHHVGAAKEPRRDWRFLDDIKGLKVVWRSSDSGKMVEYVCGSGQKEKLDWS